MTGRGAEARTIAEILRWRAVRQPNQRAYTFLTDGEAEGPGLTYAELDERSRAVAAHLQALGAEGRRVLLLIDDGPQFLTAFFGSLYAGAVAVPAYRPSTAVRQAALPRLSAIASDCQADFILSDEDLGEDARSMIASADEREVHWLSWKACAATSPETWREPRLEDNGLAFLQYTSGATAKPRGVMVTHANLMDNLAFGARAEGNDRGSIGVSWLPLHHDMGLIDGTLQPLFSGYPAYLFPPEAFLRKPLRWLQAISRYRATNSGAPNFAFDLCVHKTTPDDRASLDLSSWRVAYNGAEPVRGETLSSFWKAFRASGFRWDAFYPVYGLAESTVLVTSRPHERAPTVLTLDRDALERGRAEEAHDSARSVFRVSCGRPQSADALVIADPERRTRCGPGEVGEIWLRSPSVTPGYWNRPEETREHFGAFLEDANEGPYLRTGDLGFLHEGELYVVGRLKDVLVIRGLNYSPRDIEWTAQEAHPAVRAGGVAVFAAPGEEREQAVLLAEIHADPAKQSVPAAEAVIDCIRESVLDRHGLRMDTIALVPPRTLLKTSSGKLRRSSCRALFLADQFQVLAQSSGVDATASLELESNEQIIRFLIAEVAEAPMDSVDVHAPISHYLDSLGVVELGARLGKWVGRDVSVVELLGSGGVSRLARHLSRKVNRRPGNGSELAMMLADSRLPIEIRPEAMAEFSAAPRTILLTGATGFLGAYLLKELLDGTEATLHCLVRRGGMERIREHLESHNLWKAHFERRIVPVAGDLCSPRLGLDEAQFQELAETTDAIYHNAAAVNFLYPYRDLRDANVLGTRELLRLACQGKAKRFHFVSTLGVCYTTSARELAEDEDVLPFLPDLPLGYAETKCVAETLVRTAAERGLAASIYRLAPLTGSELTGRANEDDFLSRFIKGSIQMGAAPDLDVRLDDCPVDYASRALVALSREPRNGSLDVHHLKSSKPRHWRELVLWMNLFGYRVALRPYGEWLSGLEEVAIGHALHHLKPFFSRRVETRNGETVFLPEVYEESRRTRVHNEKTERRLARVGISGFRSSPRYLERCFTSFVERDVLPQPARRRPKGESRKSAFATDRLASILSRHLKDDSVEILDLDLEPMGIEHSILTELTSWYTARETGLYRALVRYRTAETPARTMRLFLKVKPSDDEVMAVGQVVAELCSDRLGVLFDRFKERLGFSLCHRRELAVYEVDDPRLRDTMPALYGTVREEKEGLWVLALEDITGLALLNSTDEPGRWSREPIEAAIRGLAKIHSAWYGRESDLRSQDWLGPVTTAASLSEMGEFWRALAEHAHHYFRRWAGEAAVAMQARCLDDLDQWSRGLDGLPRTLIHNDFNPRNLAFRRGNGAGLELCAYDWELATLGVPQHDLAELLCFVLSPQATTEELEHYVELHRRSLENETGASIDARDWRRGLALSLEHLIVNRFPMYTLVCRFQRKRFLEKVVPTWLGLSHLGHDARDRSRVYPGEVGTGSPRSADETL